MGRRKRQTEQSTNRAFIENSRQAENNAAESTSENRNQKGHVPNSPSTG